MNKHIIIYLILFCQIIIGIYFKENIHFRNSFDRIKNYYRLYIHYKNTFSIKFLHLNMKINTYNTQIQIFFFLI